MEPALLIVDMTLHDETDYFESYEENNPEDFLMHKVYQSNLTWPPTQVQMKFQRDMIIKLYCKTLSQVSDQLIKGNYNLEKWRRILKNTKPKVYKKIGEGEKSE